MQTVTGPHRPGQAARARLQDAALLLRRWPRSVPRFVLGAALALAALLGWLLAEMLIAMLRHVFDPPPDHLAAPWRLLLGLAGAAVFGAVLAAAIAAQRLRRLPLGAILRQQ